MAILKQSKWIIIFFSIILITCRKPIIKKYDYIHKELRIDNWDKKKESIYKVVLYQYKKDTEFQFLEKKAKAIEPFYYIEHRKVVVFNFDSIPIISTNKDYKLVINDTITYKI